MIKDTKQGTISDVNGKYSISFSDSTAILVFSFIGYLNEEVHIGQQSEINIILVQDLMCLEETVIIGYGSCILPFRIRGISSTRRRRSKTASYNPPVINYQVENQESYASISENQFKQVQNDPLSTFLSMSIKHRTQMCAGL